MPKFLLFLALSFASFCAASAEKTPAQPPDLSAADGSRYYGPLVDGKRHGIGKVLWDNGDRYEGGFEKGLFSGHGVFVSANGERAEGEFRDGRMNGQGVFTGTNGDRYEGRFKDDRFDGKGQFKTEDGLYIGEFKNNLYDGHGRYTDADSEYEGQFQQGNFHGKGRFKNENEEIYEGEFVKGQFSGEGSYTLPNKSVFRGRFLDWRLHGPGSYTDDSGNVYEGSFTHGVLNGPGKHRMKNGASYEGNFENWRYHGQGVLKQKNGDTYTGEFLYGKFHGKGTLRYAKAKADGTREITGAWQYGFPEGENRSALHAKNIEIALYNQNALLYKALADLAPSTPERIDLYALVVAGDGTQEVFRREAEFVREQFDRDYGTKNRSVVLINSRTSVARAPLATATSIRSALQGISQRMEKEQDILFVYLTSHGSKERGLSLQQGGTDFFDLSPQELARILNETGIRNRVIVVSACYSGTFIEPLKNDHSLVITAARHDRRSFGCGDENDFTYFGRAFFKEALPQSISFSQAFGKATQLVHEWETKGMQEVGDEPEEVDRGEVKPEEGKQEAAKEDHYSLPQIHSAAPIEAHLRRWRADMRVAGQAPVKTP